jgi:hypothetical protein
MTEQQFCRTCGLALESIGKLVAQHSSAVTPSQTKLDKIRAEQQIVQYMFKWITIGMIIIGIGVLMLVLNKTFDFGTIFKLASSFVLISGTGCAAYGVLSAIRKGTALPAGGSTRQLPCADEKALPMTEFPEALPSVTERTTQLIRSSGTEQEQEVK